MIRYFTGVRDSAERQILTGMATELLTILVYTSFFYAAREVHIVSAELAFTMRRCTDTQH